MRTAASLRALDESLIEPLGMSNHQKREEREDLIRLADALNFPHLKNAKDNEQPDFLVTSANGVLGIEHTLVYSDQPPGGQGGGSRIQQGGGSLQCLPASRDV